MLATRMTAGRGSTGGCGWLKSPLVWSMINAAVLTLMGWPITNWRFWVASALFYIYGEVCRGAAAGSNGESV